MVLRNAYVVARGVSGRPLTMHKLVAGSNVNIACGRDLSGLSRSYASEPLDAILCKQCAKA